MIYVIDIGEKKQYNLAHILYYFYSRDYGVYYVESFN